MQTADAFIDHDPMRRAALLDWAVRQSATPRDDGSHLEARRVLGLTATGGAAPIQETE